MEFKMKVGDVLRRILPAFDNAPKELFQKAGVDIDVLYAYDVVSIEVVYSLEPVPPDHEVKFTLQYQTDATKVTLGATDGRMQDETTQVLPT